MDGLQAGDPGQIGPFRLLGRLGEGGMGRVFLGQSPGGRKVAIKVVHPHYASDPEFRRRFAREVVTARQVGGFHTAAVVGADPDADPPWMATAYIPGPSLAEAVAQHGPLDEARVRELGAALAEGLVAIHDCGLIHRDLKPDNVILADDGPRIIDFGIAKGADATALTGSSMVIGTLRYMSPEQLQGQELTPQSDVFALGTVLAFAATGHVPFQGPAIPAVITRILTGPPDLDPLTGDLRGIIGDCLAKDPGDRPSPGGLLARFSRASLHDPTVIAAPASVPVADSVAAALPSAEFRSAEAGGPARAAQEPSLASTVNVRAVVPPARTDPPAALAGPSEARAAVAPPSASEPPRRRSQRRRGLIATGIVVAAGILTAGILTLVIRPALSLTATATLNDPASSGIDSVAFGSNGTLATGDGNGSAYLWNTATGKVTATLTDPASNGIDSVAFGSNGTLATGDGNGSAYLWNTATGKITATLTEPARSGIDSVAYGPNGTFATAGNSSGSIYLWNTATGKVTATLTDPASSGVSSVTFGPNGTLATGDRSGSAYLWNTATGKVTATLTDPASKGIESVAFGPNGTLATGDFSGSAYLWNTATSKVTATLTDPASSGVSPVAFGPNGTLATGDGNGSAYLWNTATSKVTATLAGRAGKGVESVAFGPNGLFAAGDDNGSTHLWHINYG